MVLQKPGISSVLLTVILILSDFYNIQTMTVQSASHRDIEAGFATNNEFLLRELNGAHLRVSIFAVILILLFSFTPSVTLKWFVSFTGASLVNGTNIFKRDSDI